MPKEKWIKKAMERGAIQVKRNNDTGKEMWRPMPRDVYKRQLMDKPLRPGEGILHHPEGVDLMPADIQLSGMEVSLVNAMSRETILRQYLDTLKGQYSHILIDCQPSLGMLTVNALAAANRVIIPVQAEYLPAKGLDCLLYTSRCV